ncbi:hypothetical protein QE152_g29917 [Popillia japonica]|uniref:Uncharacterized protein n=1 Tax=Popillia japonica TaxID=7064 RepID=A0AAW1JGZ3_POPJA
MKNPIEGPGKGVGEIFGSLGIFILQSSGRVDHSFSLEEFIDIDNDVVVAELPSDEEIVDTIKRVEEPEEEDEREDCTTKPSRKQVKAKLSIICL